jgi:hypothetical protein
MVSLPTIGTLYDPKWNNIAWSQPGGAGTKVFPAEAINIPWGPPNGYPVVGQIFSENSGLWTTGCQHWFNALMIFRGFDVSTGKSAAIACCPLCSFVCNILEPYESITDPMRFPVIIP